jgi:hypothetical protein
MMSESSGVEPGTYRLTIWNVRRGWLVEATTSDGRLVRPRDSY